MRGTESEGVGDVRGTERDENGARRHRETLHTVTDSKKKKETE